MFFSHVQLIIGSIIGALLITGIFSLLLYKREFEKDINRSYFVLSFFIVIFLYSSTKAFYVNSVTEAAFYEKLSNTMLFLSAFAIINFIKNYTLYDNKKWVIILRILVGCLISINLILQNGIIFKEIHGFHELKLIWGEYIKIPDVSISGFIVIPVVFIVLLIYYFFKAILFLYRKGQKTDAIVFFTCLVFVLILNLAQILLAEIPELGVYVLAYFAVVVLSIIISHRNFKNIFRAKLLDEERIRLQNLESTELLIGGISHDFRNLLTIIKGQAEILKLKVQSEEYQKNIESIIEASKNASGLTNQLIDLFHPKENRISIISIEEIVMNSMRNILSRTGITTEINFLNKMKVEADYEKITQVFDNIILNALEAMPDGGKLSVETINVKEKDGSFVKISIADTGIGIPEKNIERIFNPYFSTKPRANQKGNGLSLSICRSIIKNHGGKITVQSTLGKGTTFILWLPSTNKNI